MGRRVKMTHLFKKGDRVRRISGDWEGFSKGDVGEVIRMEWPYYLMVKSVMGNPLKNLY